ncbi:MAG: hypothetical protein JNK05_07120 [Myxococcales bacterium]|nr:hypothetical protein [Myxococcales bacterium]
MLRSRVLSLALVAAVSAACSPRVTSDAGADGGADGGTDAAPPMIHGTFGVELVRFELVRPQVSLVTAAVFDAEPPPLFRFDTTMRDGECELLVPRIPFCAQRCPSNAVCVADNTCQPRPNRVDVGAITVSGLRRNDMGPLSRFTTGAMGYQFESNELVYPPFAAGQTIQWSIAGAGTVPAMMVEMPAIDEMRVLSLTPESRPGQPLDVRWEPPAGAVPEGQRALVSLDFTHHAGLRGMISCVTADDGAMTIPAGLITGLHALGMAGFPALFVTRSVLRTREAAGHRMTFEVKSEKEIYVEIPGLRSCRSPQECPAGQRCRDDFTCGM